MIIENQYPVLIGHSSEGEEKLSSVQDVADFICTHGQKENVTITREDGSPFLNTFGIYIDRIVDMDYRNLLLPVLIPMQMEIDGTNEMEGEEDWDPISVRKRLESVFYRDSEMTVFRILVAEPGKGSERGQWIALPADRGEADHVARLCNRSHIEECSSLKLTSSIPEIDEKVFRDMNDFSLLNQIARRYIALGEGEQEKYKAALSAKQIMTVQAAADIMDHLAEYEYSPAADEDYFFKEYLAKHLDPGFDPQWLEDVAAEQAGMRLLESLGATVTDYGIISARGQSLYQLVPWPDGQTDEIDETGVDLNL